MTKKRLMWKKKSFEPGFEPATYGLPYHYSPPLYQLSYRRHLTDTCNICVFIRFSTYSAGSSVLTGSLDQYTSTHPGLDTLEENADKLKFFSALEQGRDTPLDYHKLNLQLDNTGRPSAVNQERCAC